MVQIYKNRQFDYSGLNSCFEVFFPAFVLGLNVFNRTEAMISQ